MIFENQRALVFVCHPESPPGVRDLGFDLRLSRFLTRLWRFGMTSFAFSFYVSSPALACFSTLNLTPKKLFNFSVVLCALTYTDSMPTRSPCLRCNPEVLNWPRVFRSHAPRSFALLLPFRVTGYESQVTSFVLPPVMDHVTGGEEYAGGDGDIGRRMHVLVDQFLVVADPVSDVGKDHDPDP